MKTLYKVIALATALTLGMTSCAKWEEYNTNPYGISEDMLAADYNNIGAYFPQILQSVYFNYQNYSWEFQLMTHLTCDQWCGYLASVDPFLSNQNTTTYKMVDSWIGAQWNNSYSYVMSPIHNSIKPQADNDDYYYFYAPAVVVRVMAMARTADCYGPIIYTKYGESATSNLFDSTKDAYDAFFKDLDWAHDAFDKFLTEYPDSRPFQKFDEWCGGDFKLWIKLVNSERLRLAMHLVKVDPATAKAQAEKAVSDKYGVLENAADLVQEKASSWYHPLYQIGTQWGDTGMGAVIESLLTGYNDPREAKFFTQTTHQAAVDAGMEYFSFLSGGANHAMSDYKGYSACNVQPQDPGIIFTVAEAYFLRAEGALHGWNMGGTAAELYEKGVKASFEQYGLSGEVEAYLNSSNAPADHVDPVYPANNHVALNTTTPKWDDSLTNEQKLEKISTQKYIAMYPDGLEAWTTIRRTGYPKIFPVVENYSEGVLKNEDVVRRMPYATSLQSSDPTGYASAVQLLGGTDNAATRIYWDVDKANF